MIEPSKTYGDLYLNITRDFAAKFKAGLPTPTATLTATPGTPTPTVEFVPVDGSVSGTITDTLRVRAGPSTEARILGRLRPGVSVTLLAKTADGAWWQISYPDANQRGWIASDFVSVEDNSGTLTDATNTPDNWDPLSAVNIATPTVLTPTVDASQTPTPMSTPTLAIPLSALP